MTKDDCHGTREMSRIELVAAMNAAIARAEQAEAERDALAQKIMDNGCALCPVYGCNQVKRNCLPEVLAWAREQVEAKK